MDTSPIDTWDGAADYFTFGPGSFGTWLFLIIAVLAFCAVIVRTAMHETRSYKEVHEGNVSAPVALEPDDPEL